MSAPNRAWRGAALAFFLSAYLGCASEDDPPATAGASGASAGAPVTAEGGSHTAPVGSGGRDPVGGDDTGTEDPSFWGGAPPVWVEGPNGPYTPCGEPGQACCAVQKCAGYSCCVANQCVRAGFGCGGDRGVCSGSKCETCGDLDQRCCQGSCAAYLSCGTDDVCHSCEKADCSG